MTATTLGLKSTGARTCTISLAPFEMKKTNDGSISNRKKKNCRDSVNSHEIGLTTTAADERNSINRQFSQHHQLWQPDNIWLRRGGATRQPSVAYFRERKKKKRITHSVKLKKDGRHTSIRGGTSVSPVELVLAVACSRLAEAIELLPAQLNSI